MNDTCPEIELLFDPVAQGHAQAVRHAQTCVACAAILAEHQLLERELFRLSDPLPPAALVPQVMARIADAPVPLRREIRAGVTVLALAVAACGGLLMGRPNALGNLGVGTADAARGAVSFASGFTEALSVTWHHAAAPLALIVAVVLFGSLYGMKRLMGGPGFAEAEGLS